MCGGGCWLGVNLAGGDQHSFAEARELFKGNEGDDGVRREPHRVRNESLVKGHGTLSLQRLYVCVCERDVWLAISLSIVTVGSRYIYIWIIAIERSLNAAEAFKREREQRR